MERYLGLSPSERLTNSSRMAPNPHRFRHTAAVVIVVTISVATFIGAGCSNTDANSETGRQSAASTTSTSTDTTDHIDSAVTSNQTVDPDPSQTATGDGSFTLLTGSLGANMFDNINATGDPTRIPPWTKVQVRCRIPVPADVGESIKPYWYQLADSSLDGYAPSNSFWWSGTEAEPVEQDHRDYDGRVPVCDDLSTANS